MDKKGNDNTTFVGYCTWPRRNIIRKYQSNLVNYIVLYLSYRRWVNVWTSDQHGICSRDKHNQKNINTETNFSFEHQKMIKRFKKHAKLAKNKISQFQICDVNDFHLIKKWHRIIHIFQLGMFSNVTVWKLVVFGAICRNSLFPLVVLITNWMFSESREFILWWF